MKKITKILTAVATLTATTIPLTTLVACGNKEPEPEPVPPTPPTPVDPIIPRDCLDIKDGVLYGLKEDVDLSKRTTLQIPSDVTSIADEAFNGVFTKDGAYSNINNLTFADEANSELTTIGNNAFNHCDAIRNSLEIPSSIKTIGLNAFSHTSIQTVELNEGLKIIGPGAFSKTPISNNKLVIPASVTAIEAGAFYSCDKLTGTLQILNPLTELCINSFALCKISYLDLTALKEITTVSELKFEEGCFYRLPSQVVVASWFVGDQLQSFITQLKQKYSQNTIQTVISSSLTTASSFTYSYDTQEKHAAITGLVTPENGISTEDTLCIPQTCIHNNETYTITGINKGAFENFNKEEYPNLSIIYFPTDSNVSIIGSRAFANEAFTNLAVDGLGTEVSVALEIPQSVLAIETEAFYHANLQCTLSVRGNVEMLGMGAFDVGDKADLYVTPETSPSFKNIPSNAFAKCSIKYNQYYNIVISQQKLHKNSLRFKNINKMKAIVLSQWTKYYQAEFDGNPFGFDVSTIDGQIVYPQIFDEQEEYDAANYTLLKNDIVPASWLSNYNPEIGFIKLNGPSTVVTSGPERVTGIFEFELGHEIAKPKGLSCTITLQYSIPIEGRRDIFSVKIDEGITVEGTKVSVPVTFNDGYIAEGIPVYFYVNFAYKFDPTDIKPIWEQDIANQLTIQCGDLPFHFATEGFTRTTMLDAVAYAHVHFTSEFLVRGEDIEPDLMLISNDPSWEECEMTYEIVTCTVQNRDIDLELKFVACGGDVDRYKEFAATHPYAHGYIGYMISDKNSDWTQILTGNPSTIEMHCA